MKKTFIILITLTLVLSLAVGCSSKPSQPPRTESNNSTTLKDGTYTVKGDTDDNGWTPEVTIKISGGKISEATYNEVRGMYKTEDTDYQKSFKEATDVDLIATYEEFSANLLKAQDSDTVAAVSGATSSFNTFKELAAGAISDAKSGNDLKDGKYKKTGSEDDRGWTPFLEITVKDGKIESAIYDEVSSQAFIYKTEDEAYKENFMNINKVDVLALYNRFGSDLVDKQDPAQVDATGGATQSGETFKELAEKALKQAKQ